MKKLIASRLLCVLIVAGLLLPLPAFAQTRTTPPLDPQAVDAYLRGQMAKNHLPGLAVAVVQGGQTVFLSGYGQAAPARAMTPQTQLYLGSVSKSFTALAAMQLVEQGKLELDVPVQHYLPWFQVADAGASAQITVRHLLNQTSGLSPTGDPGANDYAPTLADEVRSLRAARLTAAVGSTFQYYNQNYRVLGLLIEQVSGQAYGDYLHDHILAPLGMGRTVTGPAAAPELAQGYGQAFGLALPRPQPFRPAALPSGYIISSAEDMGRYIIALLDDARCQGCRLVQPATLAEMFTPPAGTGGTYGMGWVATASTDGERILYHDGALENYYSMVMLFPERGLGYAMLINQGSLFQQLTVDSPLAIGLANVLVGDTPPPQPPLSWVPLLLLLVAGADLLNHLRLFVRLPGWARKVAGRLRAWQWLRTLVEVVLPLALLLFLPALLGALKGESTTWAEMWGLFPDVTGWLLVGAGLSLARGLAKVAILAWHVAVPSQ